MERTLLSVGSPVAVPALVSLRNHHGLGLLLASAFHSCRSPTVALMWQMAAIHCFHSGSDGITRNWRGVLNISVRVDTNGFSSCSLGGKLEQIIQKHVQPGWSFREKFFSYWQQLSVPGYDIFDNIEHQCFKEMTLACIGPQHTVFL